MLPARESAIASLLGVFGAEVLNRHYADFFFHFRGVDHSNGIPGAAIEEAAVWAFADAFLASDAEDGVDLNAAKGWMVLIGHPKHAVFDRTVLDAGRRAGTSGAALGDYCQFFGFLLPRRGKALGFRFKFELVGDHSDGLGRSPRCGRHGRNYSVKLAGGGIESAARLTGLLTDVRARVPRVPRDGGAISSTPAGACYLSD